MKRFFISLSAFLLLFNFSVYAVPSETPACFSGNEEINSEVMPMYLFILTAANSLSISSSGKASCTASTQTDSTHTPEVKVELQKEVSKDSWETIKNWSATGSYEAYVSKTYSFSKGYTYRLRTTHYALDSEGKISEYAVKYSAEKSY